MASATTEAKLRRWPVMLFFLAVFSLSAQEKHSSAHLLVSYRSGSRMVLGYLYRPEGNGPFPGIIVHHGRKSSLMKGDISDWDHMAMFFAVRGYIVFLPDRHPETVDITEYSPGLQERMRTTPDDPAVQQQATIEKTELIGRDIVAALAWFQQQPDVKTNRISIIGHLAGAVQALYDGERNDVQALVAICPALQKWEAEPVIRGLLLSAIRKTKPPVFLIYVENNPTLAPAEALGEELRQKGKPNSSRIYPPFGK